MAISFSGGRSRSTWRETLTMGRVGSSGFTSGTRRVNLVKTRGIYICFVTERK